VEQGSLGKMARYDPALFFVFIHDAAPPSLTTRDAITREGPFPPSLKAPVSPPSKLPCPVVVFVRAVQNSFRWSRLMLFEYVIHDIIQDAIRESEKLGHLRGLRALRLEPHADDVERLRPHK